MRHCRVFGVWTRKFDLFYNRIGIEPCLIMILKDEKEKMIYASQPKFLNNGFLWYKSQIPAFAGSATP